MVIWLVIVDGLFAAAAATSSTDVSDLKSVTGVTPLTLDLYIWMIFAAIFTCSGMIISAQNQIISERKSGTAAWVMSKPVTASAFLFAKCGVLPKLLFTQVGTPFAVALIIIGDLNGKLPSPASLLFALGIAVGLNVLFYVLTLLLGTLFHNQAPVLAISFLALLVVLQSLAGTVLLSMVVDIELGHSAIPALMTLVGIFLLATLALWGAVLRFEHEEF